MTNGKIRLTVSIVALAAAGAAAAGEQRVFGDSVTTCDNRGACEILALAGEQDEDPAWLRFTREPDADRILLLSIRAPRGAPPDRRWRLYVDERPVRTVAREEIYCEADDTPGLCEGIDLTDASGIEPLLRRLLDAAQLTLTADGAPIGNVSLRGIKAAALWVDERQRRLDTPTALVRRGERPFRPPAPVPLPTLRGQTDAWQPQAGAPRVLAAARASLGTAGCVDAGRGGDRLWRHRDGRWLAALDCAFGPYWVESRWLVSRDGRAWRALPLDAPTLDDDERAGILRDAGFDETLGILSTHARGRGVGDCGVERGFVDTGAAFTLYLDRRLPVCRGVPADAWPVVYRAILGD
jgi:hypothetical protein